MHKALTITDGEARVTVRLDIDAVEDNPSATLSAYDEGDDLLGQARVAPNFTLKSGQQSALRLRVSERRRTKNCTPHP
jgi:hypothetical protein